jgi:P27 family predicted phage terminase small subunit
MAQKFKIPTDIESDAKEYMKTVLAKLEENGILENVDSAALTMLARNYSTFIRASKQLEKDGITYMSDRNNIQPHPAIKIANDAQSKAMKVMEEFGLTAKSRKKLKIEKEEESPFEAFGKNEQE